MNKPSALDRFRAAAAQREKEAKKREAEMKARHAQGKEDMKGAIDTLASRFKEDLDITEVNSEYSKKAHDLDGQALGIRPGSKPEHNPVVKHEVQNYKNSHYISVVHKSGMSYSHKGADGKTATFASKEDAEKKAAELNKSIKESYEEADAHMSKANDADAKGDKKAFHTHMANYHDAMSSWHDEKGRSATADKHAEKADYHHQKSLEMKEAIDLRAQLQKHSDAAIAANRAGDDEKVKHHMNKMNAIKDKMAKQVRNEETKLEEARSAAERLAVAKQMYDSAMRSARTPAERAQAKETYDNVVRRLKEEVVANNVGGGNIAGTQGDAGKKAVMTKEPLKRKKLTDFKEWMEEGYVSDAQRKAVWATRKDGGKGHPDNKKKNEEVEIDEAAVDSKGHKSSTGGLTQKGRDYYNNKTGGNLQAPVTTPPSKLDPDSKAAKRRKSFCARMSGMKKRLTSAKTANDPDSRINKALRKWNC